MKQYNFLNIRVGILKNSNNKSFTQQFILINKTRGTKLKKIGLLILALPYMSLIIAQTTITIDASKPGSAISKNLYGIFFEDINHAGDGGLYAELIQNRSFEANRLPEDMYRVGDFIYSKQ